MSGPARRTVSDRGDRHADRNRTASSPPPSWQRATTSAYCCLLASDRTYREPGYVALSRGRHTNRIWTVTEQDPAPSDNLAHGADPEPAADPLADLRQSMQRRAAHQLATDQVDQLEPVGVDL